MQRRPRMLISVPTGSTQVERRAIRQAALSADAFEGALIEEAATFDRTLPPSATGVSYAALRPDVHVVTGSVTVRKALDHLAALHAPAKPGPGR